MTLISIILKHCSPSFSKAVAEFLKSIRTTASKSKSEWDKVAVHTIFLIFGIDYNEK